MNRYDPLGANPQVPASLEIMARHPERGQWQAAVLLWKGSRRWPGWPLEQSLAVIDSLLEIHHANFIVRPPFGWEENPAVEPSLDLSPRAVLEQGLSPLQFVSLSNGVLGCMRVFSYVSLMTCDQRSALEDGSGRKITWHFRPLLGWNGSQVRVRLGQSAYVDFDAILPTEGSLALRAMSWAEGYATAQHGLRLFTAALAHPELLSEVM